MNLIMHTLKQISGENTDIGGWWRDQLEKSMKEAGGEERQLAIERGDYHQGVPAITVTLDRGYHIMDNSYNANSGIAIITGQAMGSFYTLMSGTSTIRHATKVRWSHNTHTIPCRILPFLLLLCKALLRTTTTVTSTEIDLLELWNLLEGFLEAESTHSLCCMWIIGDGDSNVCLTLKQMVPV